jgi:hypothetical protein
VPERVLELARSVTVELVLDRAQGRGARLRTARAKTLSTSSTYILIVTGVPPMVFGPRMPLSGYSSESMITLSPSWSSAWPILPSGSGMRIRSVAPNTGRRTRSQRWRRQHTDTA